MEFGDYLREIRKKKNYKINFLAKMLGVSACYLSGIENGLRAAPSTKLLTKTAEVLNLSTKEKFELYDLAAESKNSPALADDLIEYIYENPVIRNILRYSMECELTEKEWNTIFNFIKKNYYY